jgi:hypothetical protein
VISGESAGNLRRQLRAFAALSIWLFFTRKRGVSGRNSNPPKRIRDQASCNAMGIRYEPESSRFEVALFTTAARRRPMVMAHW